MRTIVIDDSRDFKGAWIPAEIYTISELSWTEKILLIEIINLNKLGKCYAHNQHFANMLGVSTRQVSKMVSKLTDLGYVKCEIVRDAITQEVKERIITPMEQKFVRGIEEKFDRGIEQKFQEKNTLPKESIYEESNSMLKGAISKNCADNHTNKLDYSIIRRQVGIACKKDGQNNPVRVSEVQNIVVNFLLAYERVFNEEHPRISQDVIEGIVDKILHPIEELDGADEDLYKDYCERYFRKDYKFGCDYHIAHFFTDEVMRILSYEVGYRESLPIFA